MTAWVPRRTCRRAVAALVGVLALVTAVLTGPAAGAAPDPAVTGPVTGGKGTPSLSATSFDLSSVGYVEEEYFVAGTATAYTAATPLPSDGRWSATPAATAPYRTRIVVFRPERAERFNGTVVVEWLNVSAGFDSAPDWINAHLALIRGGFAWVGVSAQVLGVQGGGPGIGGFSSPLKSADSARYAPLSHPGDSFSYDIYSQVGRLVRSPGAVDPLGGLNVRRVIGVGESQSAFRLVTYVDAVQPLAHVYDGFLIHSRSNSAAALSQAPQPSVPAPDPTFVRDDLDVPVLTFETETDLEGLHFIAARQPDTSRFRLWEVAGTAHADAYTLAGSADAGDGSAEVALVAEPPTTGILNCATPINSGPQFAVLNAAMVRLDRWVRTGKPPPRAPRLRTDGASIVRDPRGNALGGIRTPIVDAPVAALSGSGQTGSSFCFLFGTTRPFDRATLASLYPSHRAYVTRFRRSAARAVRAGFLLAPEAARLVAAARESTVGRP
jgi:Alpha/beta hydrolase domain